VHEFAYTHLHAFRAHQHMFDRSRVAALL